MEWVRTYLTALMKYCEKEKAALIWNHLYNIKKHFKFICRCSVRAPLLPSICPNNSLFLPILATLYLVMLCLLVCGVLLQLTEGYSHKRNIHHILHDSPQAKMQGTWEQWNRSHRSNPLARKCCVKISTDLCVEMWRCSAY